MASNKIIIALAVVLVIMIAAGVVFLNPSHAKIDSRIDVTSNSTLNKGDNITIKLVDLNNTPIPNQRVNITLIDAKGEKNIQEVSTDGNGEGNLQSNDLNVGNYIVNVNYGGNENYTSCNTTQNLQIKEKVSSSVSTGTSEPKKSGSNVDDDYVRDSNGNIMYAHVDVGGDVPMTKDGHYIYKDTDEPGSPSGYWVEKI